MREFILLGVQAGDAAAAVASLDRLIDKNRRQAVSGLGMDVLLEGTVKANLDRIYSELQPQVRAIRFHNPATVLEILQDVREQRRQGRLKPEQSRRIDGMMWGTYSYAPNCKGDLVVSLHVEFRDGSSVSFSCQGRPDHVSAQLASQIFQHFQGTRAQSTVLVERRRLTLLGAAPGKLWAHASSLGMAVAACRALGGRLPVCSVHAAPQSGPNRCGDGGRRPPFLLRALNPWNGAHPGPSSP